MWFVFREKSEQSDKAHGYKHSSPHKHSLFVFIILLKVVFRKVNVISQSNLSFLGCV